VVELDLAQFFDRVNHDILMSRVAKRVSDKRVLKLIRSFLTAGVMEHGLVGATDEGTPQGGPLSPLLSNLMLNDLDKLLEQRGLRFVRYADDCNVYVRSERAGQRVMMGLKTFLTGKLKLTVNEAKSAVAPPHTRKFPGFTFSNREQVKRRIAPQALARLKERIRELTQRTRGVSVDQMIGTLKRHLTGWRGYFGFCETPRVLKRLDEWIRRCIRCFFWKQWKRGRTRFKELTARGVRPDLAAQTVGSPHNAWRLGCSPALGLALPSRYQRSPGLPSVGPVG
jgi:RNA-directed DNA polymerase